MSRRAARSSDNLDGEEACGRVVRSAGRRALIGQRRIWSDVVGTRALFLDLRSTRPCVLLGLALLLARRCTGYGRISFPVLMGCKSRTN